MRAPKLAETDENVTVSIPRSALTIVESPRTVSQRSSERVLGIPKASFLHLLSEFRESGGNVMSVGKLRIVEVDPFVAWLRRRNAPAPIAKTVAPVEMSERDELEAELGIAGVAQ